MHSRHSIIRWSTSPSRNPHRHPLDMFPTKKGPSSNDRARSSACRGHENPADIKDPRNKRNIPTIAWKSLEIGFTWHPIHASLLGLYDQAECNEMDMWHRSISQNQNVWLTFDTFFPRFGRHLQLFFLKSKSWMSRTGHNAGRKQWPGQRPREMATSRLLFA